MSTKKKAVADCCCAGCGGCCLPLDYSSPLYPEGFMTNVEFCLSVPSCPSYDGICGTFVPINPTSSPRGLCGVCGSYKGEAFGTLLGQLPIALGPTCSYTPCSIDVCFTLECLASEQTAAGLDSCCGRLRLWVGTSQLQTEDDGSRPSNYSGLACNSWKKVSPSQCACAGNGFAARFPFSLSFECSQFTSGPCYGQDNCCTPFCNWSGAEIVI